MKSANGAASMDIRAAEISSILKTADRQFRRRSEVTEVGQVLSVGDGIARAYGLDKVQAGEMVEFENGTRGMALNLESDNVGIVIFGEDRDHQGRRDGQAHRRDRRSAGRQGPARPRRRRARQSDRRQGPDRRRQARRVDVKAPGIIPRRSVHEPMQTGLKAIDADPDRPRPARADHRRPPDRQDRDRIDTILNQKDQSERRREKKLYCIYVAIGQKRSTVAQIVKVLEEHGALEYTIVVAATASDPRRCSSWRRSPAARWASGSATTACTR
jgi:F-type H+-transporting ATPase subunit alpha